MTTDGISDAIDLSSAVEALRESPLHAMSLSSHELFFSNLLGWVVERFPTRSALAWNSHLTADDTAHQLRVRREWRHLDLVLELPGQRPLVVENKSLAMPDEQQLARYDEQLIQAVAKEELREPTRVLLSPVDPGWPSGVHTTPAGGTWRWLSYANLAARLESAFVTAGGSYEAETVRRLAELMKRLQSVLSSEVGKPSLDQPLGLESSTVTLLQKARVHHLVVKARARHVGGLVREQLSANGVGTVGVNTTMTRGMPLIEGLPFDPQGEGALSTADRFLWQVQGNDLRLAAVLPTLTGRTDAARKARESAADANSQWFDFNPARAILGARCGQESPKWLRFDPDFVYRKVTIAGLTVGDVVALGAHYGRALAITGAPILEGIGVRP